MAVLMPDRVLGKRAQVLVTDEHGDRYVAGWGPVTGLTEGRAREGPDTPPGLPEDRTWTLAADPALWPLSQGDLVVQVAGGAVVRTWLVTSADLITHSASDAIDYVRIEAHTNLGATAGGTSP